MKVYISFPRKKNIIEINLYNDLLYLKIPFIDYIFVLYKCKTIKTYRPDNDYPQEYIDAGLGWKDVEGF